MADKPWKAWERKVARLFGGRRHWANEGGRVDVTGAIALVQCKDVRQIAGAEMARLAEEMERLGYNHTDEQGRAVGARPGLLAVRLKRGRGHKAVELVVMTANVFRYWYRRREELDRQGDER